MDVASFEAAGYVAILWRESVKGMRIEEWRRGRYTLGCGHVAVQVGSLLYAHGPVSDAIDEAVGVVGGRGGLRDGGRDGGRLDRGRLLGVGVRHGSERVVESECVRSSIMKEGVVVVEVVIRGGGCAVTVVSGGSERSKSCTN